ncbi:hypothetical protein V1512DRAFT_260537 [Lipomyces arxii]|uniref:uncharacterized protein n=1 Tax=Lipomyces arxii TaxID=56418 RepID=UPI0034CFA36D
MLAKEHNGEGGFWNKVKKGVSNVKQGVSSVALFHDGDGDTETDTQVHKVLVDYYLRSYGYIPTFLGGTGTRPNQMPSRATNSNQPQHVDEVRQVSSPANPSNLPQRRHMPGDYGMPDTSRMSPSPPVVAAAVARKPLARTTPKSSLQDVYKQSQQQQYQSPLRNQDYLVPAGYASSVGSSNQSHSSHGRSSFDTVDSRRSTGSGESRVREMLRRRPVSPSSNYSGHSSVSSSRGSGTMSSSTSTINGTDDTIRYYNQKQNHERQYR